MSRVSSRGNWVPWNRDAKAPRPITGRQETTMRRTALTLTTLAAALAATLALAAPGGGYGPGPGAAQGADCPQQQSCGMGYGPGGGGGPGQGYGKGFGRGGGGGGGAYGSMMTEEERAEHRQKMHSFTTVGECKAYFDEHRAQMTARARERGIEPGAGPRISPCERMLNRGLLKPAA
jgi:hypothetical protein